MESLCEQSKWDDVLVAESVNKTAAFSIPPPRPPPPAFCGFGM